jgi:hypothetical protein
MQTNDSHWNKKTVRCCKKPGKFKEIGFEEVEDEPDWASSPEQVCKACLTAIHS